jgi:peroxiredoxin
MTKPSKPAVAALTVGDHAPWFSAESNLNPNFDFGTVAGRYIVLSFIRSAATDAGRGALYMWTTNQAIFSHPDRYLFIVTENAEDRKNASLGKRIPGIDVFWDLDREISTRYGISDTVGPVTFVLDPNLRVLAKIAVPNGTEHVKAVIDILQRLPPRQPSSPRPGAILAPVLTVPFVFEPDLCRRLIDGFNRGGGVESGYSTDRDGKTVNVIDHYYKRRSDWFISDAGLLDAVRDRIGRRIVPEIRKAFQFETTRIERFLVACYSSAQGGYFRAHRDNMSKGTLHRKFAVTVNLNAEEYSGGDLVFPEYGRDMFRAPTGGAIVFSCSLMHEVLPVIAGNRYAFLPFLYDEAAARIREKNARFLSQEATSQAGTRL